MTLAEGGRADGSLAHDPAVPALAICGHSGAGKTTLIERLVPALRAWGWRVAVVKRTRHDIVVDVAGKDSDRFFRAGATTCMVSPGQVFTRVAAGEPGDDVSLCELAGLVADHDLVLVEGHKQTTLPKLWLLGAGEVQPPPGVTGVLDVLRRDEDRLACALTHCRDLLAQVLVHRPLLGAVVVDGHDRGVAAATLDRLGGCVAGAVTITDDDAPAGRRLPPVPGVHDRRLAHVLAALRWGPDAAWLVVRPDPRVTSEVLAALLAQRRPGRWRIEAPAGIPATLYEPQARRGLEAAALARAPEPSGARSVRVSDPVLSPAPAPDARAG